MAIRRFTTSAAMLALIAGIGTTAMAQTAPALPAPLAGLNLNGLDIETKRDGMRKIEGRTADGVEIEAMIDMADNIVAVEADDGALPQPLIDAVVPADLRGQPAMAMFGSITEIKQRPEHLGIKGLQPTGAELEIKFDRQNALIGVEVEDGTVPADLVGTLLPQAVRDNDIVGQFDRIDEIENRGGRIEVQGIAANGETMRAEFDGDGRVLRFGRDDGPGPRHERDDERRGDRGPGGHGMRGSGQGPDHGPGRGDGPRGEDRRAGGPGGDGPGRSAPIPAGFDTVAVNQRLSQAGYGNFGFLRADGPRLILDATNPQGETVTLELDPQGEVVRESAR